MDFEIAEKTKINAKIYGSQYALTKPTVGQVEMLQHKLKDLKEDEQFPVMKSFMSQLGLPEGVVDSMELDHFNQLVEVLVSKKK